MVNNTSIPMCSDAKQTGYDFLGPIDLMSCQKVSKNERAEVTKHLKIPRNRELAKKVDNHAKLIEVTRQIEVNNNHFGSFSSTYGQIYKLLGATAISAIISGPILAGITLSGGMVILMYKTCQKSSQDSALHAEQRNLQNKLGIRWW